MTDPKKDKSSSQSSLKPKQKKVPTKQHKKKQQQEQESSLFEEQEHHQQQVNNMNMNNENNDDDDDDDDLENQNQQNQSEIDEVLCSCPNRGLCERDCLHYQFNHMEWLDDLYLSHGENLPSVDTLKKLSVNSYTSWNSLKHVDRDDLKDLEIAPMADKSILRAVIEQEKTRATTSGGGGGGNRSGGSGAITSSSSSSSFSTEQQQNQQQNIPFPRPQQQPKKTFQAKRGDWYCDCDPGESGTDNICWASKRICGRGCNATKSREREVQFV